MYECASVRTVVVVRTNGWMDSLIKVSKRWIFPFSSFSFQRDGWIDSCIDTCTSLSLLSNMATKSVVTNFLFVCTKNV